jgi:hypothetical protein
MNRLGPLIVRRTGPLAPRAIAMPIAQESVSASSLMEDVKTFALVWLGGLIFFGTYIF